MAANIIQTMKQTVKDQVLANSTLHAWEGTLLESALGEALLAAEEEAGTEVVICAVHH
jgi:hypothetical protein